MKLQQTPELHAFLSTSIANADPEGDEQATRAFIAASSPERARQVAAQAKLLLVSPELPLEELGSEANRWFGDSAEARTWLEGILGVLDSAVLGESVVVKDSNGTALAEGDTVQVIKDLKVKGGSSDLKRGMLIKKIHLIDDAENIECRVDGSTLVLKTCFLKKA
ncbi:MAG: alkylphosphonate utilization protein [Bdellovibrionota bacterium]